MLEEFTCPVGSPSAQVIETLEYHGCTVIATPDAHGPGSLVVRVYMPEDEYQAQRCRAILLEWRIVAATHH